MIRPESQAINQRKNLKSPFITVFFSFYTSEWILPRLHIQSVLSGLKRPSLPTANTYPAWLISSLDAWSTPIRECRHDQSFSSWPLISLYSCMVSHNKMTLCQILPGGKLDKYHIQWIVSFPGKILTPLCSALSTTFCIDFKWTIISIIFQAKSVLLFKIWLFSFFSNIISA